MHVEGRLLLRGLRRWTVGARWLSQSKVLYTKNGGLSEPKSHFTKVGGKPVHYIRAGEGPEPVLLLPGTLGSAATDFKLQIQHLPRDKFTVIAWDPPGFGKSRPPERDYKDQYATDAVAGRELMHQLGFPSFNAVGWSAGGTTALIMASRYPESVRKLVLLAGFAYVTQTEVNNMELVSNIEYWSDKMKKPMFDMYGDDFPRLWDDACNFGRELFASGGDICSKELGNIRAPTLVTHGEQDMNAPVEHASYLAAHIKGAKKVVFPEGKHNLHFKFHKEFNQLVTDFILEQNQLD